MKKYIIVWAVAFACALYCREEVSPFEQFRLGNLALPEAQQEAPLFSFGQLIIPQGSFLGWLFFDYIHGDNGQKYSALNANLLYGIRNNLALSFTLPFVVVQQSGGIRVNGVSDALIELEYAYYVKHWYTATLQATILGAFTVPLGVPPLAGGTPTFFLGTTLSYLSIDWYAFTSYGAYLPTTFCGNKYGNEFLYEFGVGHHIANKHGMVIAFVIEMDGVFTQKNKIKGIPDPNSGGNEIGIGPSLWIATEDIVIQPGIQAIICPHLNGNQDKDRFIVSLDFSYSFN